MSKNEVTITVHYPAGMIWQSDGAQEESYKAAEDVLMALQSKIDELNALLPTRRDDLARASIDAAMMWLLHSGSSGVHSPGAIKAVAEYVLVPGVAEVAYIIADAMITEGKKSCTTH